jgi:hypothetical protein
MRLKKFKALAFWVRDRLRRSMDLDPTVFTDVVLLESIQNMDSEKEIKDTKARDDIPIPKFTSGVDFPRWMDDFRNALGAQVGASGVTLNYVVRPVAVPETFIDARERLIYETTHEGHSYRRDNSEVYKTLQAAMDAEDKTSGWPYVKPFERAQDGRAAWLALVQHYGAGGEEKKRVELAKATMKNLHYRDEQSFTFENFTTKLTDCLRVLEEAREGYTENQKVDALIEQIHNKDPRFVIHVETVRATMADDYEAAVRHLSNMAVQIFPFAHQSNKQRGRRGAFRRTSQVCQFSRGGGGRGGRGGQRFQGPRDVGSRVGGRGRGNGRGRGRNSDRVYAAGVDITDITREFTSQEQNQLFQAGLWTHVQNERRRLSGRGREQGSRGGFARGDGGDGRQGGRAGRDVHARDVHAILSSLHDQVSQLSDDTQYAGPTTNRGPQNRLAFAERSGGGGAGRGGRN